MPDEPVVPPVEKVEAAEASVSTEPPVAQLAVARAKIDVAKLFLPGAIVIAALLISGTLLYVKFSGSTTQKQAEAVLTASNLKKWAKQIKVDTKEFNQCFDEARYQEEVTSDIAAGQAAGVEGTPTFYINGKVLIGAQPYTAFQTAIDQALKNPSAKLPKGAPSIDTDPMLGDVNAPVTIIEFSDFECPYCRIWWVNTYPELKRDYIDTGKVRFVYRDFPLSFHAGAMPASLAAECANAQGKFWEMFGKIFTEQEKADPVATQ